MSFRRTPLAFRERSIRRGDEQDQVGFGNEVLGEGLVLPVEGVSAGGIDELNLAQKGERLGHHFDAVPVNGSRSLLAVDNSMNLPGRRRHTFFQRRAAEKGVEESALA